MRLSCVPGRALREVRRQLPIRCIHSGQSQTRDSSSPRTQQSFDAAVIGGGITGLASAFRLSQLENCRKVTLYEKSPRLGGWLQSEIVPVDKGEVVFEYGPRTLRTGPLSCLPLLNLVAALDLVNDVVPTSKKSPASINRYIYYPDHLVRVPTPDPNKGVLSNVWSMVNTLLQEPAFESFLSSLFLETLKSPREFMKDESVAEFVSRRFHPKVADNLVSAVYHGIYAGDIDSLSAQTLLGPYWDLEMREIGLLRSFMDMMTSRTKFLYMDDFLATAVFVRGQADDNMRKLLVALEGASVFTFRRGMNQLSDALVAKLKESRKVDIITDAQVTSLTQNPETSDLTVSFGHDGSNSRVHNRVIATAPAPALVKILETSSQQKGIRKPQDSIRCLREHNHAVTVMIVNLYYSNPDLLPVQGFGYLIPRSISMDQNPERALGVIFGSSSSVGQDTAPGTKVTVILGGHWWDDWHHTDFPDHDSAVKMARSLLQRHLHVTDTPLEARTRLQKNAIPQYTVGHQMRMHELSGAIRDEFRHRLTLAGNWYGDAGVTDCVKQAYLASTYGVGDVRLRDFDDGVRSRFAPWTRYSYQEWDLEGGIVTSPVRWFESSGKANVNVARLDKKKKEEKE